MEFQQRDMKEARKTMTMELLEGKLQPQEQRREAQTEERELKRGRLVKSVSGKVPTEPRTYRASSRASFPLLPGPEKQCAGRSSATQT